MELVDILQPPKFEKTGIVKTRKEALKDNDWVGCGNVWIFQSKPQPAIVYQIRSMNSSLLPGKLDVSVGGHYQTGEAMTDIVREAEEELGRSYKPEDLTYIGKKLYFGINIHNVPVKSVVNVFFIIDNTPIDEYKLDSQEVSGLVLCPIEDIIRVFEEDYTFEAQSISHDSIKQLVTVNRDSFPYNWDNYHEKIPFLGQRFINGEKHIFY